MKAVIIICSLLAVLFVSCDGMNDNIKEYLDRGEIAYIGKADSVTTAGGINRIKLLWKINSDPRITSCKILWNDKQDSVKSRKNRCFLSSPMPFRILNSFVRL